MMRSLSASSSSPQSSRPKAAPTVPHRLPPEFVWVDSSEALHELLARLRAAPRVALDTESNSMHAYRERICLLQLSLPEHDVLIDPLAVDIRPLGEILADPSVEKVMHGADYDVLCFKREYGFVIEGLFDTMLAARVLGWGAYGLGAILAERYGFRANKKMQRFDWGQRPLPAHALEYARWDTRFLVALQLEQLEQLRDAGREDELRHACERQCRVEPRPRKAERLGMWRIKGARDLPSRGRATLHALYELREQVAETLDRPVFRVMGDELLLRLARRPPRNAEQLAALRGLHPSLRGQGRARLWAAIEAARDREPPRPPPIDRGPPRDQVKRFDALRTWRKATAQARGVEPDIVLGKDVLMAVAAADPRSTEQLERCGALDAWELNRYADGLIAALCAHAGS